MEDSPRHSVEENTDDNSDINENSDKRKTSQDFLDRWRRFSSRDSGLSLRLSEQEESKESDEDEDEEKEDDDSESEHLTSPARKRFRRLRRLRLSPYLPQKNEVPEKSKRDLASSIDNMNSDPSENEGNLDNTLPSQEIAQSEVSKVDEDFEAGDGSTIEADHTASLPNEITPGVTQPRNETEQQDQDPEYSELPSLAGSIDVPETESIVDILHRREQEDQALRHASEYSNVSQFTDNTVEQSVYASETHPEVVQHNAPVGGLLAVDLLNYRIAKKRDNKNKALNEKQHENITTEQREENERIKARILKSELQQKSIEQSVKVSAKTPNQQIATPNREVIYNRNRVQNSDSTPISTEHIPVAAETSRSHNTLSHDAEREDKTTRNFEHTLRRVEEAEMGKISSEFQFERRHEVMDEPGGSRGIVTTPVSYDGDHSDESSLHELMKRTEAKVGTDSDTAFRDESRQSVYKQAAITGIWGAVVGIIAFIIMYMLAS